MTNVKMGKPRPKGFEIRDRRTGEVALNVSDWGRILKENAWNDTLRGQYLGHRIPKDFRSADLRGLDLSEADLTGRDLSDADLTGTTLTGTRFDTRTRWPLGFDPERQGAVQVPVDLKGAQLDFGNLSGGDFTDGDLRGAILIRANLQNTVLVRANLTGASLLGADLTGADLTDAIVGGVFADETTRWPEGFDLKAQQAAKPKETPPTLDELVGFFKTLADPTRLRLLGLLSHDEQTGEELASALDISEPTVSHHLAKLKAHGLLVVRPEGTRRLHRLDKDRLETLLQNLPEQALRIARGGVDDETFERKVLSSYFEGGRLKQIPYRQKKLHVVLRRLVQEFDYEALYTEKQVSEILARFNEDFATLRRELINFRYMARENSVYWRLPEPRRVSEEGEKD
jgi:biotin operon repressor